MYLQGSSEYEHLVSGGELSWTQDETGLHVTLTRGGWTPYEVTENHKDDSWDRLEWAEGVFWNRDTVHYSGVLEGIEQPQLLNVAHRQWRSH